MKLTESQYKSIEQYEPYFDTAVHSQWARHPGQMALDAINKVFCEVMKTNRRLNTSCQTCVLHLLQDVGKMYFADKAEYIAQKNRKTFVDKTLEEVNPVKKVVIKTKKKKNGVQS